MENQQQLYAYLCGFLSEQRQQRFEEVLKYRTRHFTVVVEDVYQEQNASALIRSCDCLGIQDAHIVEQGNEYKVARSIARGAEKWVDLHYYRQPPHSNSTRACLDTLRQQGYRIIATSPHQEANGLATFDIRERAAFFFGHEKKGLSEEVMEQADQLITIPSFGFTESYNVSVAMALLLYDLVNRLHQTVDVCWQLSETEKWEKRVEWAKKSILNIEKILKRYPSY
ncbi:MAG: RNA methyltransferase [Cyclobacteriaceae bacterium]